jgi:hypothetical protein
MFKEKHMLFVSLNLLRNSIGVLLFLYLRVVRSISFFFITANEIMSMKLLLQILPGAD